MSIVPNGLMDQDATWYGGKRRPGRRYVRWSSSSPYKAHSPQFLVHVYYGQTAGQMKTPLDTDVDTAAPLFFGPCLL